MKRICACYDGDARTCFELRHYGYSPAVENDPNENDDLFGQPEECDCACHFEDDDHDPQGWE